MRWKDLNLTQRFIALLSIIFVLMTLQWIGILRPITGLFSPLTSPLLRSTGSLSSNLQQFAMAMNNLANTRKEIDSLEHENNALLAENTRLKEFEGENTSLRQQLNFSTSHHYSLLPATIIGKEPVNFIKYLTLDQGQTSGIKENMVVVSPEGLLVGKVIKVDTWQSQVLIITDGESSVPAMVQSTRTDGIVKGQSFGYGLTMELVPVDVPLKKNDVIITSGLGGTFPKGLFLGVVSSVESNPSDIFQQAVIRPQINFNQLETVAILLQNAETP